MHDDPPLYRAVLAEHPDAAATLAAMGPAEPPLPRRVRGVALATAEQNTGDLLRMQPENERSVA